LVETINPKCIPVGCDLLGQVDYYGAVLGRKDLILRRGDFRNSKLGLIIDLIKTVDAPDELKTKLTSAIIDAWRMDAPDSSLEEMAEEMGYILRSIEAIRRTVQWSKRHPGSKTGKMLDIAVMFAVPLMPSDLNPEEVRPIHDLLGQLVDSLSRTD
jgi:hypothetical protein